MLRSEANSRIKVNGFEMSLVDAVHALASRPTNDTDDLRAEDCHCRDWPFKCEDTCPSETRIRLLKMKERLTPARFARNDAEQKAFFEGFRREVARERLRKHDADKTTPTP